MASGWVDDRIWEAKVNLAGHTLGEPTDSRYMCSAETALVGH